MLRRSAANLGLGALMGSTVPVVAWAGPAEGAAKEAADLPSEDSGAAKSDALQKDPVGPPPAVQVDALPRTRHNVYAGFALFVGANNYDTLPQIKPAASLGLGFRMGARVVDAFAIGGQVHAIFALARQSGSSGTFLLEGSVFPLKKRNHQGLALHIGAGVLSMTRREPDVDMNLIDLTKGRFVTTGGAAAMLGVGWDLWLQNKFNFGIHARFDGGLVPDRPQAPSPDPRTRPFVWAPSLELAMNWY